MPQITCQKCNKQIKAGEKYVSETFPDAFKPQIVYYCEPCGKERQNEDRIKTCKDCGNPMYSTNCGRCEVNDRLRRERERERESKIQTIHPTDFVRAVVKNVANMTI